MKTGKFWVMITVIMCLAAFLSLLFYDRQILGFTENLSAEVKQYFEVITWFGRSDPYLVTSLLVFVFFRYFNQNIRLARQSLFVFLTVAVSGIIVNILKIIFGRARPILWREEGYFGFDFFRVGYEYASFPSGHAVTVFALAAALHLLHPRGAFYYYSLALLVAMSRVVLGAHYLSDVLAGASLGIVSSILLGEYLRRRGFLLLEEGAAERGARTTVK